MHPWCQELGRLYIDDDGGGNHTSRYLKRILNASQTQFKRSSKSPRTRLKRTSNAPRTHLERTSSAPQTHLKRTSKIIENQHEPSGAALG